MHKEVNFMKDQIEHIDYALVARTHTPMYLMHKYWARKPHNVVSEYIKHYSKEGDIVLDPFCGSGVTAIEALKLGRKAIAIDLDPVATFITRETAIPIDLKDFEQAFKDIEKMLRKKIYELYITSCPKCKKEAIVEAVIWEGAKPKDIRYSCSCSKGTKWKDVTGEDLKRLKEINRRKIPYWYPKNELIWNSRINVREGEKVYELFTKRNLLALSMILNEIEKIEDEKVRDLLNFTFTSALAQASKLVFVYRMKGRNRDVGGWATRGYWVPNEYFEINAWNCFQERFNKIRRGKEESNNSIKNYREAKNFNELNNGANILIETFNTLELDNIIPPNSVDYIFTDPPYGDAVPYLELDYMWSSWLKLTPNFVDEIIISDSPSREKTAEVYERMLKAAFNQIYKVLKPGKYMTVTFHNTDIKVWNAIISACIYAGFDLDKIIYQAPARPSAKGLLAPYGSAVGDYYIRFRKPETEIQKDMGKIDEKRYQRIVIESSKRIIAERGEPTPYTYILSGIIVELKKEGALLTGRQNPDDAMKSLLGKEFILVDVKDEKGDNIGKKWWFRDPTSIPYLKFIPLADRVETAVVDVLRRKVKVSFDDILQEIFIKFPNALTPETQKINEVLSEYANKTSDGKWILKPSVKFRESQHSEMIFYLGILGKKAGFDVWIGQKEQGDTFKERKLSELCTKREPVFQNVGYQNMHRVKQIDVIWHKRGRIYYEFEVENTTAVTEAIVRGSNISDEEVKRFIVIPEERESLLYKKVEEPILKESVEKNNWKFISYKDLQLLFKMGRGKKGIIINELENLGRMPKKKEPPKQLNLTGF